MGGQRSKTCETHLIISFFSGENKKKVQGRRVTRENLVSWDEDMNSNKRHFEISPHGPKARLGEVCEGPRVLGLLLALGGIPLDPADKKLGETGGRSNFEPAGLSL